MPPSTILPPAGRAGRAGADAPAISRKTFACAFKALDDSPTGSFECYAAVFGNLDRQDDVILPGAFSNLAEFVADGFGLLEHRIGDLPIAIIDSAVQDARGLKVVGRFHSTPEAQAVRAVVRERMEAGKSVKCSIGYAADDFELVKTAGGAVVRRIKSLRVFEFSFVNLPANPEAGVTAAKSAEPPVQPTPQPAPEAAMIHNTEAKPGVIEALKQWLGLATKAGRSVSKSNHAALVKFADAMDEHGKGSAEHVKALKGLARALEDHGAISSKLAAEMKAFLAPHDPTAESEPDGDEAESEPDGDEAPDRKSLHARLKVHRP